jgi:hypothetical protein
MNSQIPPDIMALLEELSQGGVAEDNNDLLGAQYKTAGELRRTEMPKAQMYGANHVAPINPMEQAAAAIQQYRGGQQQRDLMDQMKVNQGITGKGARALMLAKLLRDYPVQAPQAAPVAPPTPGFSPGATPPGPFEGP